MNPIERYMSSFLGNSLRLLLSTIIGFLIARELGPISFGNYSYLMLIATATISLIDFSYSKAFFTFLSSERINNENLIQMIWLVSAQLMTLILVVFCIPSSVMDSMLFKDSKVYFIVALIAIFIQQRVWMIIGYLYEYLRLTSQYQFIYTLAAVFNLMLLLSLISTNMLSFENIFIAIAVSWSGAVLVSLVKGNFTMKLIDKTKLQFKSDTGAFVTYCWPLLPMSLLVFFNHTFDRWMLQKFSILGEQGYFAISKQVSVLALIATTSILNVLWREVSALRNNKEKQIELVRQTTIGLYIFTSFLAFMLIPWSEYLIRVFFGDEYLPAKYTFIIMLVFPIHQCLGQVGGVVLLSLEKTKEQVMIVSATVIINLIISGLILMVVSNGVIVGGLTSFQLALKLVFLQIITVNVLIAFTYRVTSVGIIGWEQVSIPIVLFILSLLIKGIVDFVFPGQALYGTALFLVMFFSFTVLVINFLPKLFGLNVNVVNSFKQKIKESLA